MPSLAPGLGEKTNTVATFLKEKPTTLGVGGKCPDWCHGVVKISHGRAASFGKSQQLQARWEMFGQAPGLGENLARIRSRHSGKINDSARQPSGKDSSSRRGWKMSG